jgi:hypothetical protein
MTKWFTEWQASFLKQYHDMFDPLAKNLRDKVKQEEADQEKEKQNFLWEIKGGGGGSKEGKKEKEGGGGSNMMDKLKMLGIEMDEDDVMAEDAHDPASLILNAHNRLVKNDMAAMETMEECYDVLVGLHSAQLLVGKFKVNFGLSGLDFVEAFPKIPSIAEVKKECEERRTAMKERSAAKMKEERMKRIKEREEAEAKAAAEERKRERELLEAR